MQLIFDVASGLKGLGLLADLCGLHSAPRGKNFEIKAIKHARSYHPKTKYSLARRRFYEAAFICVRVDKSVINISNSLAKTNIIFALTLASIWFGLTCLFLDLKKLSPNPRWGLGVLCQIRLFSFSVIPINLRCGDRAYIECKNMVQNQTDYLYYDPTYQQFGANCPKI